MLEICFWSSGRRYFYALLIQRDTNKTADKNLLVSYLKSRLFPVFEYTNKCYNIITIFLTKPIPASSPPILLFTGVQFIHP